MRKMTQTEWLKRGGFLDKSHFSTLLSAIQMELEPVCVCGTVMKHRSTIRRWQRSCEEMVWVKWVCDFQSSWTRSPFAMRR